MKTLKFANRIKGGDYEHVLPLGNGFSPTVSEMAGGYQHLWVTTLSLVMAFIVTAIVLVANVINLTNLDTLWAWPIGLAPFGYLLLGFLGEGKIPNQRGLELGSYYLEQTEICLEKLARELKLESYEKLKAMSHDEVRQMAFDAGARIAMCVRQAKQEGGEIAWYAQRELHDFNEVLEGLCLAPDGGIAAYGRRAKELEAS